MRTRSFATVLAAAALVFVTGGPSSLAEGDAFQNRPFSPGRGSFFPFGQGQRGSVWVEPRRQRVAPVAPRRVARPVVVREAPVVPDVAATHHIAVLGDSLGTLLAGGLEDALSDRPDVAVLDRSKPDSGLVRNDFHDWAKAATEILAGDAKIAAGVILVGLNDRQALREGEIVHEPGSPRWLELYRDRIDAVAAAFAARRIPLVWVGAPPMQNGRLSVDLATFNDLFRQRVERAGGHYVDLWGGFVDAENRYAALGPDVSGQTMRLRLGDGIHFTDAGARKAAHFVEAALRRHIETRAPGSAIALPVAPETGAPADPELQPGGIERLIDQMVAGLPAIALSSALMAKPAAGPVLPLTGQATPGEAALLTTLAEARGTSEVAAQLDLVFAQGIVPEPRPGRLDDHRWPR